MQCERCKKETADIRTLWMACNASMSEIGVPFEVIVIDCKHTNYPFYTIQVCKDCRADWLMFIRAWYYNKPLQPVVFEAPWEDDNSKKADPT